MKPQINHHGELNNIEKVSITFVNVQQGNICVKIFLLMVELAVKLNGNGSFKERYTNSATSRNEINII